MSPYINQLGFLYLPFLSMGTIKDRLLSHLGSVDAHHEAPPAPENVPAQIHDRKPSLLETFGKLTPGIRSIICHSVVTDFRLSKSLTWAYSQPYIRPLLFSLDFQSAESAVRSAWKPTVNWITVSASALLHSKTTPTEPMWHVKGQPNFAFGNMNKDVVPRLKGIRIEIVAPDPGSGASYAERVYDIARRRYMIFLGLHTAKRKSDLDNARPVCFQEIAIAMIGNGCGMR